MMRQPETPFEVTRVALNLVREPVFVIDLAASHIVDANRAACEALCCAHAELLARHWSAVAPLLGTTTMSHVDEHRAVVVAHELSAGSLPGTLAPRDTLTGLPNRAALSALAIDRGTQTDSRRQGLLFIDLDGFKRVNDTFGHLAGDHVLRSVAQRLTESVRPQDLVVRFGGDEFVVVLENVSRRRDLQRLANRMVRAIARPIFFGAHEITMSASIGCARRSAEFETMDELLAAADRAMYEEKALRHATAAGPGAPPRLSACHTG